MQPGWPYASLSIFRTQSGRGMQTWDYSLNGEQQATSYSKAQAAIPATRMQYAYWQAWSQNDGVTQTAFDNAYQAVLDFIALCQANGVIPVIGTHIPTTNLTDSTQDARRLALNTQVRALSGIVLVDFATDLNDGATPQRIPAGMSYDGQHPTASGQAVMATTFATAMANYIASH